MKILKNLLTKNGVYILVLLWAIVCFTFFQGWYHYHFFYQEQNQLFLMSSDYLLTYFQRPAWLACMLGDFLTQFYYYLYAGPVILTLALLVTGDLTRRALKAADIQSRWLTFGGAFAIMTIEALFSLHYAYRLSSIFAFAGGAGLFWTSTRFLTFLRHLYGKIEERHEWHTTIAGIALPHYFSFLIILVCVPLCFWLFGYGMWVYAALVLTGSVLNIKQPANYVRLAFLVIPMFLLMLTKRIYYLDFSTLYSYPGMGKFVKPEFGLEKAFAVDDEYYFGNYNKVIKIVESETAPTLYMKFYYNLVMAQRMSLPDKLLAYPSNNLGTFEKIGPNTPILTIKASNELYWLLGDMTFAERAATLALVCSPDNRNIRMIKRLAEVNLVSGEYAAAKKYLRILQNTFVWKSWANNLLNALEQPQQSNERTIALRTYNEKANFSNKTDTIRLGDNAYTIMHELLESNPENRIALDYLLCSDLLLKDIATFKKDYDDFCYKMENPPYEVKLYQEALMIYLAGTNAPQKEWEKYIHRTDILQRFEQYNNQRGNAAFADTYWYYFDKAATPKIEQ